MKPKKELSVEQAQAEKAYFKAEALKYGLNPEMVEKAAKEYGFSADTLAHPERASVQLPGAEIPSFRTAIALARDAGHRIMFKTWGGLGDQICAEPSLRFGLRTFKDCEVYLASEKPELFAHLPFKRVFNLKEEIPLWKDYLVLDTIKPPGTLVWEFFSHMITNCVDFPSLCSMRCQLPIADRIVTLKPNMPTKQELTDLAQRDDVVYIHAGKHWQSKTFPIEWWNRVLAHLIASDLVPVLIGANQNVAGGNQTTVEVDTHGCIDLRNRCSVMETVWLLQRATVLLTNDSSPLHMAVTGTAHIGFVATCKHPDFIQHWRSNLEGKPEWAWRMKNFGKGGAWDLFHNCPNRKESLEIENVGDDNLRAWLPEPEAFAEWAVEKTKEG